MPRQDAPARPGRLSLGYRLAAAAIWAAVAFSLGRLGQPAGAALGHAPCAACPRGAARAPTLQSPG